MKLYKYLEEYSLPLIFGVFFALVCAHFWEPYFLWQAKLHFSINEVFMAFFFGLAMVEIVHAFQPNGDLRPISKAVLPLLATIGGVVGPVIVFYFFCQIYGNPNYWRGWGIVTATDIALAWLVARIIFGKHHPALSFLLLLAILDDAIGMGIIAFFYPNPLHAFQPIWLLLVVLAMALGYFFRKWKMPFGMQILIPPFFSWLGLYLAHLHPALALVFTIPFLSPAHLDKFESLFGPIVTVGLFFFGFVNAGVKIEGISSLSIAIFASLLIGKTLGVFLFSLIGKLAGVPLPNGMSLKDCVIVGIIAGIGLTVALFVASAAYADPVYLAEAKTGALLSIVCAPIAWLATKLIRK